MKETFRKSMLLLHTWAGVVIGGLLFAIFWMGTLSVFDREIDRWMMPATRLAEPPPSVSLDATVRPAADKLAAGSHQWLVTLPTQRAPILLFRYRDAASGKFISRYLDPRTGTLLPDQKSFGGTGFIFPFHFSLHLRWYDLGYWLVGLAGMVMLVLLISGVIIHQKILVDFFTFRPKKTLPRSSLDLHNLTGVLALPFHFVMALSGLIIFFGIYFPLSIAAPYGGDRQAFSQEVFGSYQRRPTKQPGQLASLDAMMAEAERRWGGGRPSLVRVWHPGDANAYVEIRRSYAHDITMNLDQIYFDAASGAVLHRFEARPVVTAQRFISGLHFVQFNHWTLRWFYFLAGLSSCVMIATGFLFWLESRRKRHAQEGLAGVRVVEGLTVGSTTGIVIATLAFFIANRLLPPDLANRASLEVWAFYLAWIATFAHAWLRPTHQARRAWIEQSWAVAALAPCAVALNWVTTGDHLFETLARGSWSVAGMDLMLGCAAVTAAWAARRMQRGALRGIVHAGTSQAAVREVPYA